MESGQDKLQELIVRHCAILRANADLLAGCVARMSDPDNASGQPARDALHIAHQVAGAGGSIGFHEISAIASDIERALQPIVAINGMPSAAQKARIDALVHRLQRVAAELKPQMSTLYRLDVAAIAGERHRA
jgi:HPt (histidine-containing phosphotransfer) domain-containing protein